MKRFLPALVCLLFLTPGGSQDAPPVPGDSSSSSTPTGRVTLLWDPNPEAGITGYKVYVSGEPGLFPIADRIIDVGNVTETPLDGLVVGNSYAVIVTAYNAYDLESPPSEELVFTFSPRPPKPTGVRVMDMTLEVSENLTDWRQIATVWRVEVPEAAGFARVKLEESQ